MADLRIDHASARRMFVTTAQTHKGKLFFAWIAKQPWFKQFGPHTREGKALVGDPYFSGRLLGRARRRGLTYQIGGYVR